MHTSHSILSLHVDAPTTRPPLQAEPSDAASQASEKEIAGHSQSATPMDAQPAEAATTSKVIIKRLKEFVISNFLLINFCVALTLALAWPMPGEIVSSWQTQNVRIIQAANNFLVFLVSGLTLRTEEIKRAFTRWKGMTFGTLSILAITPMLGFGARALPLQPSEFSQGLAIFCTVPTTLGVGVALVGVARGNQALALLLTVLTNLAGIATVPYMLKLVLHGVDNIGINPADLLVKLVLTVLVPTLIGKLATSCLPLVQNFVQRFKVELGLFSTANLTLSAARNTLLGQRATHVLAVIACAIAQHVIYLAANSLCVWPIKLDLDEAIAVVIMSSQKSAPVAVTVLTYITSDADQMGLLAIPALCGQIAQIFIGSFLVKYLVKLADKEAAD